MRKLVLTSFQIQELVLIKILGSSAISSLMNTSFFEKKDYNSTQVFYCLSVYNLFFFFYIVGNLFAGLIKKKDAD